MVKNGPKKSAPECPVECGGGGPIAIWAMPKCRGRQTNRVFPNPMNDSITDEKCRSLVIFYLTQGNVVFAIIDPADFQKYSLVELLVSTALKDLSYI